MKKTFLREMYFIIGSIFMFSGWLMMGKLFQQIDLKLFALFGLSNIVMAYSTKDSCGISDLLIHRSINKKRLDGPLLLKIIIIAFICFSVIFISEFIQQFELINTIFILISIVSMASTFYLIYQDKVIFKKIWSIIDA